MFNLKKQAEKINESYEALLQSQNTSDDLEVDGSLIGDKQLDGLRHNEDIIDTTEVQMEDSRAKVAESITEYQLENTDTDLTVLRDDRNDSLSVQPLDLLNQAQEQERLKKFQKLNTEGDDTGFWDKYVGSEMIGPRTKMINKMGPSQLQNHEERFSTLSTDPAEISNNKKFDKMVTASLKDADALLFHIYCTAAGRDLTDSESKLVDAITKEKIKVLSFGENQVSPQHMAKRAKELHARLEIMEREGISHTDPKWESTLAQWHETLEVLRPSLKTDPSRGMNESGVQNHGVEPFIR